MTVPNTSCALRRPAAEKEWGSSPTLLTWPASHIAWDVKRELWHLTAGFRNGFSHRWRFEPTDMESIRYNPLLEIRRGQNEVRDAQAVADMLVALPAPRSSFSAPKPDDSGVPITEDAGELRLGDEARQREKRTDRPGSVQQRSLPQKLHHFQASAYRWESAPGARFLHQVMPYGPT